jgi:hypothetical protein
VDPFERGDHCVIQPPIEQGDVTTIMRLLSDIQIDVSRIRELMEEDNGEEEEVPEDDS